MIEEWKKKKKIDKVEPKITLLKVIINKMVENMILDRIE